jgi:sodium/potassium-transporting ATPase subunit alpha
MGIALFLLVFVTSVFTYVQEQQSDSIMESFKQIMADEAHVIRDGEDKTILASELVVGDIVRLKPGNKVPADMRIIYCKGIHNIRYSIIQWTDLKLDNSSLTGESALIYGTKDCTSKNMLDSKNMCFFGTWVRDGNALGVVVATGDDTWMGRIAVLHLNVMILLTLI